MGIAEAVTERGRTGLGRGLRLLGRALAKRWPRCGGNGLFLTWFKMRDVCPTCGLDLERKESGYVVGAYMLNIAVSEAIWLATMVAIAVATWPNPPWDLLLYGGAGLMILAPIAFYPWSKTLFLAADLWIRQEG